MRTTLITQEQITEQILQLNEDYRSGKLKITHKQYLVKYNRIKNLNSVANQVKRFGAKVTKDGCAGYYIYNGVNFTVGFNETSCETTWWEVAYWNDNVDPRVVEQYDDYNHFYTKNEVVWSLLGLDEKISKELNK